MVDEIMQKLREKQLVVVLLGLVVMVGVLIGVSFSNRSPAEPDFPTYAVLEKEQTEVEEVDRLQTILVDVKGEVKQPGVYELDTDSRVQDVIALAGGLTAEANQQAINLAQKLTDEAVVYVPSFEEELEEPVGLLSLTSASNSDKVNINTADQAQLQTISGIGAKRAQDIIDYREVNGRFQTVDDLTKVSGIGEKTLEKIRDAISLD